MYCQGLYGMDMRQLDYEEFYIAFEELHRLLLEARQHGRTHVLGIPKYIGCWRAGGEWSIVMAMLNHIFLDSPIKLVIVEYIKKDSSKEEAKQNYEDRKNLTK